MSICSRCVTDLFNQNAMLNKPHPEAVNFFPFYIQWHMPSAFGIK